MTYRDEILADTPVAYWRAEETSGTTLADETGNGHTGTVVGANLNVAGRDNLGSAIGYDGVDDRSTHGLLGSWGSTNAKTIEFWLRTTTTASGWIFGVVNDGNFLVMAALNRDHTEASTLNGFHIAHRPASSSQVARTGVVNSLWRDGAWHHVVITIDITNSVHRLWFDAVEQTLTVGTTSGGTSENLGYPLAFACRNNRGAMQGFALADVDEIALYSAHLTQTRIQAHYDAATAAGGPVQASAAGAGTGVGTAGGDTGVTAATAGAGEGTGTTDASTQTTGTAAGAGEGTGTAAAGTLVAGAASGVGQGAGTSTGAVTVAGAADGAGTGVGTTAGSTLTTATAAGSGTGQGTAAGGTTATATAAGTGTGVGEVATATGPVQAAASGAGTGTGDAAGSTLVTTAAAGAGEGAGHAAASTVVTAAGSGAGTATGQATAAVTVTATAAGAGLGVGQVTVAPDIVGEPVIVTWHTAVPTTWTTRVPTRWTSKIPAVDWTTKVRT